MKAVITVADEAKTIEAAEIVAAFLEPGDVLLLEGELGAGKTTFTKGIAKGLNINSVIRSPTYTLVREYPNGRLPLYHMDVYRLEEGGGSELGLEEYIYGKGVSVIEWAKFIQEDLPDTFLKIELSVLEEDFMGRRITFEAVGSLYEERLEAIKNKFSEAGIV